MSITGFGGKTFDGLTIGAGHGEVPALATTLTGTVEANDYVEMIAGLPVAAADFVWGTTAASSDINPNPMRTLQIFEDVNGNAITKLERSALYRAAPAAPAITDPQFKFEHFKPDNQSGAADVTSGAYLFSRLFKAAEMASAPPGIPSLITSTAIEEIFWEPASHTAAPFTVPQSITVAVDNGDVVRTEVSFSAETALHAGIQGEYTWAVNAVAANGAAFTTVDGGAPVGVNSSTLNYLPQTGTHILHVTSPGTITIFVGLGPWGGTTPPVTASIEAFGFNMITKRYSASSAGTVIELPPFDVGVSTVESFVNSFAAGDGAAKGYAGDESGSRVQTSNSFVVITENGPAEVNAATGMLPIWDIYPRGRALSTETIAIMAGNFGGSRDCG